MKPSRPPSRAIAVALVGLARFTERAFVASASADRTKTRTAEVPKGTEKYRFGTTRYRFGTKRCRLGTTKYRFFKPPNPQLLLPQRLMNSIRRPRALFRQIRNICPPTPPSALLTARPRSTTRQDARLSGCVMTDGQLVRQALAGATPAYETLVRRWA